MSARPIRPKHGGWRRLMWWKRLHPAAELLCGLLMAGKGWEQTTYILKHRDCHVSFWIANRWYGFGICINGLNVSPNDTAGIDRWSRKIVLAHVKAFLRNGNATANSAEVVDLARRVTREFTSHIGERAA